MSMLELIAASLSLKAACKASGAFTRPYVIVTDGPRSGVHPSLKKLMILIFDAEFLEGKNSS